MPLPRLLQGRYRTGATRADPSASLFVRGILPKTRYILSKVSIFQIRYHYAISGVVRPTQMNLGVDWFSDRIVLRMYKLFSTHPATEESIARLEPMIRQRAPVAV